MAVASEPDNTPLPGTVFTPRQVRVLQTCRHRHGNFAGGWLCLRDGGHCLSGLEGGKAASPPAPSPPPPSCISPRMRASARFPLMATGSPSIAVERGTRDCGDRPQDRQDAGPHQAQARISLDRVRLGPSYRFRSLGPEHTPRSSSGLGRWPLTPEKQGFETPTGRHPTLVLFTTQLGERAARLSRRR